MAACAQLQVAVKAGHAHRLPATGGGRLGLALSVVIAALVVRLALRRPRSAASLLVVVVLAAVAGTGVAPARAAECQPTDLAAAAVPAPPGLGFVSMAFSAGGGEPNIAVSPNGKIVLASGLGGGAPAALYRSVDGGVHFTQIKPAFPAAGGGDFDMRFLDDHTVIAADLSLTPPGINIDRSTDDGDHWTTTTIRIDVFDRPWLDHFGADLVYVVAKGFDGVPYVFTSTDGGRTFGVQGLPVTLPTQLIYGTGTVPAELGGTSPNAVEGIGGSLNSYVDHLTVDPRTGDVYVLYGIDGAEAMVANPPAGFSNRLYVAHLEQGTMVSHPVYLGVPTDSFVSGFNWMTVDGHSTLYVLGNGAMNGHHSTRLWYSKDHGVTWTGPADLAPPGAANVYGSIAAGDPGVLSLVYLRGSNENPSTAQDWYVEMGRVTGADTKTPSVERDRALAAPVHQRDICFDGILCGVPGFGSDRNLLDYIWNVVGPDGTAFAVIASDGPATGHPKSAAESTPDVVILRQVAGRSHGRGAPS